MHLTKFAGTCLVLDLVLTVQVYSLPFPTFFICCYITQLMNYRIRIFRTKCIPVLDGILRNCPRLLNCNTRKCTGYYEAMKHLTIDLLFATIYMLLLNYCLCLLRERTSLVFCVSYLFPIYLPRCMYINTY